MRARRGIAQRYIDRLGLVKKGLRPLLAQALGMASGRETLQIGASCLESKT